MKVYTYIVKIALPDNTPELDEYEDIIDQGYICSFADLNSYMVKRTNVEHIDIAYENDPGENYENYDLWLEEAIKRTSDI